MDSAPRELSLAEIRSFMLRNNCKVTNHALVKHFRAFLTNKETQDEARKLFKSYVNTLASIKNDGAEKFLILRKKYVDECPSEDAANLNIPMSPGSRSLTTVPSDGENSPFKNPPPYRPPPEVLDQVNSHPYQGSPRESIALSRKNSSETCRSGSEYSFGSEFTGSDRKIGSAGVRSESGDSRLRSELARKQSVELYRFDSQEESAPAIPPRKRTSVDQTGGQLRQFSVEEKVSDPAKNVSVSASDSIESESNKENHIQQEEAAVVDGDGGAKPASSEQQLEENKLSVKEKMMKFNRFASEEEAKVPSPLGKKKPEKNYDDTLSTENLLQHPKAKEWLIAAANANYQELAKLSTDYPNLVKLQDMSTGYTALHWAAKHGNEDVVKLVAGTLKADVNARTNGGYTALHIAMQFGRNDIFELLCNVYKADRDLLDWSGKKPLEYQKQMTTVSASTYSKIKARKKHTEKDSGFLRIGSLNVRVKKTTEAFSNFLGVGTNTTRLPPNMRTSAPPNSAYFDKLHKSWGSADNIPNEDGTMPPPKYGSVKKRRPKRDVEYDPGNDHFSQSVPTTPSQTRAPIGILAENPDTESENLGDSDSDTACGFDSNWRPTYL